jgi:hypothetical protein
VYGTLGLRVDIYNVPLRSGQYIDSSDNMILSEALGDEVSFPLDSVPVYAKKSVYAGYTLLGCFS